MYWMIDEKIAIPKKEEYILLKMEWEKRKWWLIPGLLKADISPSEFN
jgi:hypothetical protein